MIKKFFPAKKAVERSLLLDVSIAAQNIGFPCPVAISSAVWKDCLTWCTNQKEHHKKITPDKHLNNILGFALTAFRSGGWKNDEKIYFVFQSSTGYSAYDNKFKMVRSTYEGESTITIMQRDEA